MTIRKLLLYLDQNILTLLAGILIVVIPLYPKLPLAELLQGYIVRMRLEDLLVLGSLIIWFVQLLRKRITLPHNPIISAMLVYLLIGLLSVLSALFVTHTVPLEKAHIFKTVFHLLRRLEYFSVFLITYSAIRSKKDLRLLLKVGLITLAGVVIYGMGQKYLYWPAFSTMNREFSKGVRLYLQPNTRLFSTFGGHYDLAAYLMLLLSFTVTAGWTQVRSLAKYGLYLISIFAYWCLVLTTSRTSFIGYVAGITLIALLLIKKRGWWWSLKHYLLTMIISVVIMFSFSNLLERFTQVIPNQQTRETILALQKALNQPFVREPNGKNTVAEIPSLLAFLFRSEPLKTIELTDAEKSQLDIVASDSDMPPSPSKPTPTPNSSLPSDVTTDEEAIRQDMIKNEGGTYNGPGYSPNALKYGLSMGIRLDALWPQALKGFTTNPALGTGYATLNKTNVTEFTYAESTDNDYLRWLGETGLLGALSFLVIIYFGLRQSSQLLHSPSNTLQLIGLGFIGATVGMLLTATYIDIFESSKVAYTYWTLAAIVAYLYDHNYTQKNS